MASGTVIRRGGAYTLESTLPKFVVETLSLHEGDMLQWEIDFIGGQKVLIARKAEKSGTGV